MEDFIGLDWSFLLLEVAAVIGVFFFVLNGFNFLLEKCGVLELLLDACFIFFKTVSVT
jgi:hypothetical protein